MPSRKSTWQFVNIHGQPLRDLGRRSPLAAGADDPADEAAPDDPARPSAAVRGRPGGAVAGHPLAPEDVQQVFDALCLAGGGRRSREQLVTLLRLLDWRLADGRPFSAAHVVRACATLAEGGQVELTDARLAAPAPQARLQRLPALLARRGLKSLWLIWVWAAGGGHGSMPTPDTLPFYLSIQGHEAAGLALLLLASGADADAYIGLPFGLRQSLSGRPLAQALGELQAMGEIRRVHPSLLVRLLPMLDAEGWLQDQPGLLDWLDAEVDRAPAQMAEALILMVVDRRLHAGRREDMDRALEVLHRRFDRPVASEPAYRAADLALKGRFAEAAEAFGPALKVLGRHLERRKGLLPARTAQLLPLAWMRQPDAQAWNQARKFCAAEAGTRQPNPRSGWGRWVHAIDMRLGTAPLEKLYFAPPWHRQPGSVAWQPGEADAVASSVVLAAWLGETPPGWTAAQLQQLSDQLHAQGLPWKADLLLQACLRVGLPAPLRPAQAPPPWPVAYFPPRQAAWQDALSVIMALGEAGAAGATAGAVPLLTWQLALDEDGRPFDLQALEPSATGRGRLKPVSPGVLKKRVRLDPRDAAVVRSVRQSPHYSRSWAYDLTQATLALVGHPALELADAPGVPVDLREGLPVLEVQRQRVKADPPAGRPAAAAEGDAEECFAFRLQDPLLADDPPRLVYHCLPGEDEQAEATRRDTIRVLRDAPDRARLLRISAAQRRVAELVSKHWRVPVQAQGELDAALRVLSGHFVLHSDAEAGDPVPADPRLVAQLQPRGDDLQLQVLVRPFGDFGPLLPPAAGRPRLMTLHGGLTLATRRDLAAEAGHLQTLLEALPLLGEAPPDATWLLTDPEDALAVVHGLARLREPAAGAADPAADAPPPPLRAVEWPKGQPLRVITPATRALQLRVKSDRDWLGLEGELQIDEGRVLSLQQVLGLLHGARSQRFVALGQGEYLVLAEHLRQRLADLAALADAEAGAGAEVRLGHTAAAWLADAADDLGLQGDAAWHERARRLEAAAGLHLATPAGLQAALRPYQAEGWLWMARLAHAGFGACLADDMGLGKTVQTLALLLHRAALGPALVVAPTSVCANWLAEAGRFAPGLRARLYGVDGEREAQLRTAVAGEVLIVSYALLTGEIEGFARREWATLVLDEAQALKNAATQRAKAVGQLQAGFRLALSGTPVENRLADLWSIMHLLNPGLLGSANRFAERFANPIERQRHEATRARLRRLVSPFLLRRTKAQVLADLPPRTEMIHRVEPSAEERAFLEALRRAAVARVAALDMADGRAAFNVLAELTRLRRAACDPRLAAPELGLIGAKVQAFERLATELVEGRHQALVFSQFTDFLRLLAERLDAAGLRYQYLDGSTPAAARAERVAAFQRGQGDLFLISLKAGGFGLNLTAADYVIIADPWWNPAAEDQAMGRAHRIGQLRPVTVYRLVTAGSIEERIVALHRDKRELADGLLADQDSSATPRAEDLVALLREVVG